MTITVVCVTTFPFWYINENCYYLVKGDQMGLAQS